MKYALNHSYKFKDIKVPFMAGAMQASMIMTCEVVNIFCILSRNTTFDVVISFLGLAVIMNFDNNFYTALGANPDKELLTDPGYEDLLWTIRRTSSS